MEEYFDMVSVRFMNTFVRTAQCRSARWVVLSAVVHGYACVVCAVRVMSILLHEGRAHDLIYNTMFV